MSSPTQANLTAFTETLLPAKPRVCLVDKYELPDGLAIGAYTSEALLPFCFRKEVRRDGLEKPYSGVGETLSEACGQLVWKDRLRVKKRKWVRCAPRA